jgi:outer membrane lipoprotein SlyB
MDSQNNGSQRPRLHPLVAAAAVAVIALSAVGITAFVMNRSSATPSPYDAAPVAAAPAATAPANEPPPRIASAPSKPVYDAPPPPPPRYEPPTQVAAAAPACRECGTVEAVHDIKVKGQGTGVGAVGGAVVGGLLGNMVGAGRGKALATVAGAVGGGFGGNAIEKNVRSETEYQTVVRLDDGGTRTFTQASPPPYGVGERVRIRDGHLERG